MRLIKASEIGEYVYCHRAWWLRHVQGLSSANVRQMADGSASHAGHGRMVGLASTLRALAILLVVVALLILLQSLLSHS